MKVLFVTHWFPKKEKPSQGVFIIEHAKALIHSGVDLTLLSIQFQKGYFPKATIVDKVYQGINVKEVSLTFFSYKLAYVAPWILLKVYGRFFRKLALDFSLYDVVNSNVLLPAGYFGYFLANCIRKPHVITEHWSKAHFHLRGKLYKFSSGHSRSILRKSSALTTVSKFTLNNLKNSVTDLPEIVQITPNIVPSPTTYSIKEESTNKYLKLLAVANWKTSKTDPKLPYLIIDSVAQFSVNNPDLKIELSFAGGGDAIPLMKKYSENLNIDFRWKGFLTKPELYKLFQDSDIFLHASKTETFSLVIAEALKNGLPVIASNVGAIPELVSEADGVLCENTIHDFVSALEVMTKDPKNKKEIVERNRGRFTEQEVSRCFLEVYNLIL